MADFDVNNFDKLRIGLASAETIRSWSRGEVKKPETINYRTLKPEKDGLFCEKIFGPTKDWECACGKYKRVRFKDIVCERCGVEVTRSKVRRERMGHIELAAPVSHIWYFKGSPSRLGYLLDIAPKELEKVLYFAASMITHVDDEAREADAADLKEELEADLDELEAQQASEREEAIAHRDHLIAVAKGEEEPDEYDDYDEDLSPEEQIRVAEENCEEELVDIDEDFADRRGLRKDAFDQFMKISPRMLIPDEALFHEMKVNYSDYFEGGMGAEAVRRLLEDIDLEETSANLREIIRDGKGQKRAKAIKHLKVVEAFIRSTNSPTDMILDVIPVIPPELRPMVQLDGGRFATSDLNDLYRRVINRNNRLKRLLDLGAPDIIVANEKRMLQEAVDSLFDNGRRGRPVTGPGNRPLKSISDMLKGKQGRFRQNLLGKRVDYSGRSVIVVGPELKLHQCGLPKKMALELFKPFVMKRLVELEHVGNIKAAKRAVDRGRGVVWDVLEEVITDHPVLLNRAPTLHRLGIQAFEPVLVEGKAIRLHPLVCTAFNADFDGDQMAVHVPLSAEAQAEARVLMLSANNIKSPAHGRPLTVPSQDMIIGLYYLTAMREGMPGEGRVFASEDDAINAYDSRADVDLQAKVIVRFQRDTTVKDGWLDGADGEELKAGTRIETTIGRIIFNRSLTDDYPYVNYEVNKKEIARIVEDCTRRYTLSEMGPILDELKRLGFHYATRAGVTVSVWDATVPAEKGELLAAADKKVAAIDDDYDMGLMSSVDRHNAIVKIWNETNDEVGDAMEESFDKFNPIYMMAHSGARGNMKQIRQLAGMRGLMADPKGEIIDRPIKANFREGLSVLEYFISTHGARKGLADTALRTADSGYLTRRLVDVAQDVIIREDDCGTDEGMEFPLVTKKGELDDNLVGRCSLNPVADPKTGEILVEANEYFTDTKMIQALIDRGVENVMIRTVMTCHAKRGVCKKCYGWDLATSKEVNIGNAVGIIAAQSIGEPGTQLTMRTFHTGGVAGEDITHGLPRVQELFEARKPKGQAVLADISGTLSVTSDKTSRFLTITNKEGEITEYQVPVRAQMMLGVEDGSEVVIGQQLTKGSVNPHDLLRLTDPNTTLHYIVAQVQEVYVSQGVSINDKHIEVISRQMLRKVTVTDAGDSDYLPGRQVDRFEFQAEAERLALEGKEPPVGVPLLLGITKASLATDSFLSAASFQETTKVLTEAALEGKEDDLNGLKENVIIGKPIPAGTGLKKYRTVGITYRGQKVDAPTATDVRLPDSAPAELKEIEDLLPTPADWSLDGDYMGFIGQDGELISLPGHPSPLARTLPPDVAKLYVFDDLGVSQRWANKFSEASIETVGDLVGKTEEELLKIEGIGAKAIEELRAGLAERDLLYLLEGDIRPSASHTFDDESTIDVTELLGTVFSPGEDFLVHEEDLLGVPGDNTEGAEDPTAANAIIMDGSDMGDLVEAKETVESVEVDDSNDE